MNTLTTTLCRLVGSELQVDPDAVASGATFEQLELDSLELIEFVVVLENEFGVDVGDDEIDPTFTVGDVASLLQGKGVPA